MVKKFENMNMKDVILENWKNKISYPFNHKDLEELEKIIDYYEGENKELRKQLKISETNEETYYLEIKGIAEALELNENSIVEDIYQKILGLKNQQKKFIEYLEDYIEVLKSQQENVNGLDILEEETLFILEETLEKYKEIIGEKDEEI